MTGGERYGGGGGTAATVADCRWFGFVQVCVRKMMNRLKSPAEEREQGKVKSEGKLSIN